MRHRSRLLLIFAAALLLARFVHLEKAPFILDEPHLQLLLDEALRSHRVPLESLRGMKDIAYGPTALWFYLPVRFFSSKVTALLAWNALASVFGIVALYFAARLAAGKKVAAWTAAFAASSPYFFMYSRLAWDQPLFIPLVGSLAWILARIARKIPKERAKRRPKKRQGIATWIALGLVCGLCFNLHFSTFPVLFGVTVVIVSLSPSLGRIAAAAAAFLATVIPYLMKLSARRGNFSLTFWPEDALRSLYYSSRFFSWKGMNYFFSPPFLTHEPARALFLIDWSYVLRIAAVLSIFVWVRKAWRERSLARIPALLVFGIASWLALLMFYAIARPDLKHPHYFLPVWWVLIFFASWAIVHWKGKLRAVLEACGWLTLVLNATFIAASWSWVDANQGARTLNYGPSETELGRVLEALCVEARALDVTTERGTRVGLIGSNPFPASFQYLSAHDPACSGLKMDFFRVLDEPKSKPDFTIEYRMKSGESAGLALKQSD